MRRAALLGLSCVAVACSAATSEPELRPTSDAPSPWLTPSATAPPPPSSGSAATAAQKAPDVVFDPNAPIIRGPAGAMRSVPGPTGGAHDLRPTVGVDRIARQLEMARQAARRCYQRALQRSPDLRGKLGMRVVFDAAGKATRVESIERENVEDELSACIAGALRHLEIEPGGGEREITIPFVLVPAR